MKTPLLSLVCVVAVLLSSPCFAADEHISDELYIFSNGLRGLSLEDQAAVVAKLGYAGIAYSGCAQPAERVAVCAEQGIRAQSIYVGAKVGPSGASFDPGLPAAIEAYKGKNVDLWLFVQGPRGSEPAKYDEQAVETIRKIADLAAAADLRVSLYPHQGFYIERVEDSLRLIEKIDRENVGTCINVCHWLRVGDRANMEERIRQAMPHLFAVNINGCDNEGGWRELIQTLDRGEYDLVPMLRLLDKLGYRGLFGLQCYAIPGDPKENAARSIEAWRKLRAAAIQ